MKTSTDSKAVADDLVQLSEEQLSKLAQFIAHGSGLNSLHANSLMIHARAHADALARKDAEIAELRKEVEALKFDGQILVKESDDREAWMQRAERAEARVREAPVVQAVAKIPQSGAFSGIDVATIAITGERAKKLYGKCVALVLLDTEEAK